MNQKIFILLTIALFCSIQSRAQTSSSSGEKNYVVTYTPRVGGIYQSYQIYGRPANEVNKTVQYFDGLGRPIQIVETFASPQGRDIVQSIEYDAFGREAKKYLPYADGSNYGNYKSNALTSQSSFYNSGGTYGVVTIPSAGGITPSFAETRFDSSPLNRVLEQGAPGSAWQLSNGHTLKLEYGPNTAGEVCLWTINTGGGATCTNSFYGAGQLHKTISKDENWTSGKAGTTEEFKDIEGRVILKKIWENETVSLSTFYVYDDFGNLRYAIPPAVGATSFTEASADLPFTQFIYAYHYDNRNRLIEKKIPGKGWEYIIYNKRDQVIATQDANQQSQNQWLFTKYDAFGRIALTGLYTNGSGRAAVQEIADGVSTYWETRSGSTYTSNAFPASGTNLTVNYYDDYSFDPLYTFAGHTFGSWVSTKTKGLLTGSLVNILGTGNNLQSVNYYDDYSRLIQSHVQHQLGGSDRIDYLYSFTGELTDSKRIHTSSGGNVNIINKYVYDHVGRKVKTFQTIGSSNAVKLSELEYNEVGQLKTKDLHNNLQRTTYTYNERGWLKSGISDQFSMALNYQDGTTPQWNGNISNQNWGTSAPNVNTFTYQYDKLNRLISSISNTGLNETGPNGYIEYDAMGNIKKLNRSNPSGNTAFIYNYTGNRLQNVGGLTSTDYGYDANGNVVYDASKGISISYNVLNLPQSAGNITYTYDATGRKLRKQSGTVITDYINGIQYTNNVPDFIQTEEGRALNMAGTYKYQYNLTDHLGNVRYSFDIYNGGVRKIQQDDYYAFGKRAPNYAGSAENKYLYNGKELQEELGQYDYGARFYDPVIARWSAADPLAELYRRWSPYTYAMNNPVRFIDPDGMSSTDALGREKYDERGMYIAPYDREEVSDDAVYSLVNQQQAMWRAEQDNARMLSSIFEAGSNAFFDLMKGAIGRADAVTGFAAWQEMMANKEGMDWYGPGGKGNWTLGSVATGLELFSGVTRIGNDFSIRTATSNGRVFLGNQYVKTFSLSKVGGVLGQLSAGAGVAMDGIGVINYYQNPNSPNAVHPGKATLNTAMSANGLWVNPPAAVLYFGVDAFHPGGWPGFLQNLGNTQAQINRISNYSNASRIIPFGPK